jgi:Ni/Co efflux regulator RcnB
MMRRSLIAVIAAALLAGPFAAPAAADHDPVREAFCRLAEKLGVVWVQDCNLH